MSVNKPHKVIRDMLSKDQGNSSSNSNNNNSLTREPRTISCRHSHQHRFSRIIQEITGNSSSINRLNQPCSNSNLQLEVDLLDLPLQAQIILVDQHW